MKCKRCGLNGHVGASLIRVCISKGAHVYPMAFSDASWVGKGKKDPFLLFVLFVYFSWVHLFM